MLLYPPFVPGQIVLGEDRISGFRTVKIQANNATWWFALDYGCAMVKSRVDFGEQGGVSEKNLVVLTPGEPAPDLFNVRSDFREVPRSKVATGSR